MLHVAEGSATDNCERVSLSQFRQLSAPEQILLLTSERDTTSEAAAASAQRVAKLMAVTVEPAGRQQLLVELVQQDAACHLPWLVHVFERLRLQRQVQSNCLSRYVSHRVLFGLCPANHASSAIQHQSCCSGCKSVI